MKFSKFLKQNICHAILLGFISQLCGTFALAAQQPNQNNWDQYATADHNESQKNNLESLILEYLQQADSSENAPSAALMRCYERMLNGDETLVVEDVIEAMPELVGFAMLQYEKEATRSHKENIFDGFNKKYAESTFANRGLSKCGFYKWFCDLKGIKEKLKKCCKQIHIDFKHTWSLIEECCESTHSLIEQCCKETQSLIEECCEQTQSNFEHTWSLIEECCEGTQSIINACCKETQSLIEECCEQTQSNFEHTWSLIEECCEGTQSIINACCKETQSLIEECCEQTQSNFEHTWSLIENLEVTVSVDFTEVLTTLSACCVHTQSLIEECCEQTQSNFEHTWSLIEECCDGTQSIINACCKETQSLIEECCEQTQSNFEHTWSLIENLEVTVSVDFTEVLTTLSADFEHTWSLIAECCKGTQSIINACCKETQSLIEECCEQTQSNFEHTWSLIGECCEELHEKLEETQSILVECCLQTQSNFEFTWSLIEHLNVNCDLTEVLTTLSADFAITWSKLDDLEECCESNCVKLDCIKEMLVKSSAAHIQVTGPMEINTPGTYVLVNDIQGKISINVGNVILNLNGFEVINMSGDGIFVGDVANVVIQNGVVTSPTNNSINLNGAFNVTIVNVYFAASSIGLNANNVSSLALQHCVFYNSAAAISFVNVTSGAMIECQFVRNLAAPGQPIITYNTVTNMTLRDSYIANNICSGAPAMNIVGSHDLKFMNLRVNENSSTSGVFAGIMMDAGSDTSAFENCAFNLNTGTDQVYGLWLQGSKSITVVACKASENATSGTETLAGFYLDGAQNCTINDSIADGHLSSLNNSAGILIDSSSTGCSVMQNILLNNIFGIWNQGSTTTGLLQNYATSNTTNYNGVSPILRLTLSTGTFLAADVPPVAPYFNNLANISAI